MTQTIAPHSPVSETELQTLDTVTQLYTYLDNLFDQDVDADTLFAGGYLRGFISLAATAFGDENQSITPDLLTAISAKIKQSKTELSPQDAVIVDNFWLKLQSKVVLS
jgi:hypothetical protein